MIYLEWMEILHKFFIVASLHILYPSQYHNYNQIYCGSGHSCKQFCMLSDEGISTSINDRHYRYSINNGSQHCPQYDTNLQCDPVEAKNTGTFNQNGFLTINSTALPDPMYRTAFVHVGIYGSFSRVTGLVRNVFTCKSDMWPRVVDLLFSSDTLTDVSNSGRFSSSLSMFCRSHSHLITDSLRFHNSRNVVAMEWKWIGI